MEKELQALEKDLPENAKWIVGYMRKHRCRYRPAKSDFMKTHYNLEMKRFDHCIEWEDEDMILTDLEQRFDHLWSAWEPKGVWETVVKTPSKAWTPEQRVLIRQTPIPLLAKIFNTGEPRMWAWNYKLLVGDDCDQLYQP